MLKVLSFRRVLVCLLLLGCCGCATRRAVELDAQHPSVRVSVQGVLFGDTFVEPQEVAEILEDYDVPHDRTIHIQLDSDVKDLRPARMLMGLLARAGYTRPVLVTKRHAESVNIGKKKPQSMSAGRASSAVSEKKVIRYKGANE